jgi:myo-inositol-1(or 4)-monophosphatase
VSAIDLEELKGWLREAGDIARGMFNSVSGHRKADQTYVTEADFAVERLLVERLAVRYPEYGMLGEEQARTGTDREFVWALDPIDGTASFVAGLPIWCISLGLLRAGTPFMGVLSFPLMDDWYWAMPGEPAYRNGQVLQVAPDRTWDSEDWIAVPSNSHRRFTIDFPGKTRGLGATAAAICYAARGSAVGALTVRSSLWDYAAALAVLHAAGGVAIGLSGEPLATAELLDGRVQREPIVCGAPSHVAALRERIRELPRG